MDNNRFWSETGKHLTIIFFLYFHTPYFYHFHQILLVFATIVPNCPCYHINWLGEINHPWMCPLEWPGPVGTDIPWNKKKNIIYDKKNFIKNFHVNVFLLTFKWTRMTTLIWSNAQKNDWKTNGPMDRRNSKPSILNSRREH